MKFEVASLPFASNAMEPHISERTVLIHYEKHHKGYMKKLDAALEADDKRRDQTLEQIVSSSNGKIFNCAAQVWNHSFYWNSLDPSGKSAPDSNLQTKIDAAFGSMAELKQQLRAVAAGEFGSGWGWLVWHRKEDKLSVLSTTDAENPIPGNSEINTSEDLVPLLTVDVWEHAYYLDYQNERGKYLAAIVDNALNWEFASNNLAAAG